MDALSYEHAVTSWAAHLRAGGTTPWSEFEAAREEGPLPRPLPDSVHLELVRRINLAAGGVPPPGLVDHVLATGSPGRGLVDIPLPWPEAPHRFGSPAVDPAELPTDELVRLAVGVLARLLPGVPVVPPAPVRVRWPLPWRRRFRLHGSPGTVAAVREVLLARGLVESNWRTTHVVIARPVEVMMAEHWAASVHTGGILRWSTLWKRARAAGRLPHRIDVSAIADRIQEQTAARGRGRLHVVVARDTDRAVALVAGLLGVRPEPAPESGDPSASDLLRRLNRLAALTSGAEHVREISATLVRVLADPPVSGKARAAITPRGAVPWARATAEATRDALTHAGYPVHGDPDALVPVAHRRSETIDRDRTLELAVTANLRAWRLQEGQT